MAVKVAKRRVNLGFIAAVKGVFHDLHEQERVVIGWRDFARGGVLVPKLPGFEVHQRFNVDSRDIQVACILLVQRGHGLGKGDVQFRVVAHVEHAGVCSVPCFSRVAGGKGTNQVLLQLRAVVHHFERLLDRVVAGTKTWRPVVI